MAKKGSSKKGSRKREVKILRDNAMGVTRPALVRILRKAGGVRAGTLLWTELRAYMMSATRALMSKVVAVTEYDGHKTVKELYVHAAVRSMGLDLAIGVARVGSSSRLTKTVIYHTGEKTGETTRRAKSGRVALREVRFYQQNSDTLTIPREAMKRVIRETAQDFSLGMKFTKRALILIQAIIEAYLIQLSEIAVRLALHADRKAVYPKDLQVANSIATMSKLAGSLGRIHV